jgi:hypothetical protein
MADHLSAITWFDGNGLIPMQLPDGPVETTDGIHALGSPDVTSRDPEMSSEAAPSHLASLQAECHELRAELEQIRAERNRISECQRTIMELLGTTSPDRLVHDIRNVLNERQLLRTLAELD